MTAYIHAYDRNTGKKLDGLVPRDYLRIFPHLSETPTSKRRRSATTRVAPASPPALIADEDTPATPAPWADNSTPQEESHAPQSD